MRLSLTPKAKQSLKNITDYIKNESDSTQTAKNFFSLSINDTSQEGQTTTRIHLF